MVKKGSWISALKKALGFGKKKEKQNHKSKKWSEKQKNVDLDSTYVETTIVDHAPPPVEQVNLTESENEQNNIVSSVALPNAAASEEAVAKEEIVEDVVPLTAAAHYLCKSKEEIAAIKIQTAFRGYMSRRALRALRGLARLKTMIQGQAVKRQAASTLRCMQTLTRVQSQIRARRQRMSEENLAFQRQLLLKHEKEQEKLKASQSGDNWNDSTRSKEQVEAKLQSKQEAAIRRERALAYSYTHQRHPAKPTNQTFMDPNNPHWGWNWLERWMAARPWEDKSTIDKELNTDQATATITTNQATSVGALHRRELHFNNGPPPTTPKHSRPPSRQSTTTPRSNLRRITPASPRGSNVDDDSRSVDSAQSDHRRRHSIAGSSIRDVESLASSPAGPSYSTATESVKTKSRLPSPLGFEKNETPEKGTVKSAKKRLSFSASPRGPRRHSDPQKM